MADDIETIHTWFSLSYANYLVVPRSILQSMPDGWQKSFVDLLEEARDKYRHLDHPSSYMVQARGNNGKFIKDPIPHYNRGRTKLKGTK